MNNNKNNNNSNIRINKAFSDKQGFKFQKSKTYYGFFRSLEEYTCPAFIGLSIQDSQGPEQIRRRCLKVMGYSWDS